MKARQQGFTLIELVVVIVILGILAATALPKLVSLDSQAKIAVVQGTLGALSSAATMQYGSTKSANTLAVIEAATIKDANVTWVTTTCSAVADTTVHARYGADTTTDQTTVLDKSLCSG